MTKPLVIYAVIMQPEGYVVGAWRDRDLAELVMRKGRGDECLVKFVEATPDPLGEALNSGDGSYRP